MSPFIITNSSSFCKPNFFFNNFSQSDKSIIEAFAWSNSPDNIFWSFWSSNLTEVSSIVILFPIII